MRRRNSCAWTLAVSLALAILLSLAAHPNLVGTSGTGMSAPPASRVSVESPASVKLPPSYHGWAQTPHITGFSLALPAIGTAGGLRPCGAFVAFAYDPLHHRPPPRFS